MTASDTKSEKIVLQIETYLRERKIDIERLEKLGNSKAEASGKEYPFDRHIKGLIYSLLSNQRKWITVIPKLSAIDSLFFDYDVDKILIHPPEYFIDAIYRLKCGNISTEKQMKALHHNIKVFQSIVTDHGSLDTFFAGYSTNELARMFSDLHSKYKLKCVGYALAWQYLRNIGFDGAKPDVHLRRILGADRLAYSDRNVASEDDVIDAIDVMSSETGLTCSYINDLLWYYCSDGYGNVCNAKPKCGDCVINQYCRYGDKR